MYFIPDKLPISGLDWQALAPLIGRANAKLSNYNGILHNMVNPKILLSPLTKQEAVLSSKIEGTRASLSDIYQKDLGEKYDQEKENDIEEINNYRNALAFATEDLTRRPLCLNMLKDIHFAYRQGKVTIVRKLKKDELELLHKVEIKYKAYKYKIYLR